MGKLPEFGLQRCSWVTSDPIYQKYHDEEWGVPIYNSLQLFEMICLEGAQAGLSWITILKKRENYRHAFDYFDPQMIASYGEEKISSLLTNQGIVRHRGKIEAFISNAKAYLLMEERGEDLSAFIWSFVHGDPIMNQLEKNQLPPDSSTDIAHQMSKALKKKGFKFVGSTTCYAFMQAAGLVDDHEAICYKRNQTSI